MNQCRVNKESMPVSLFHLFNNRGQTNLEDNVVVEKEDF
jgi:hypothetical protein